MSTFDVWLRIILITFSTIVIMSSSVSATGKREEALLKMSVFRRLKDVIIPKLDFKKQHKGSSGRIGIIGGSLEYTGAPYYAGIASLRVGADLAFVFCGHSEAAMPIKTYSPELIVYPNLNYLSSTLTRLSSLVIGPGLGRDEATLKQVSEIIALARKENIPLVLDGDALWLLKDRPEILRGYEKAIITPNAVEFERLYKAAFNDDAPKANFDRVGSTQQNDSGKATIGEITLNIKEEPALTVAKVANWLGGVTVMRKGFIDVISDGKIAIGSGGFGSPRRCGGQGDVLAGSCGVFIGWAASSSDEFSIPAAAFGASLLTRRASGMAFEIHERSMVTPDMIQSIGPAFHSLFVDQKAPWCSL